MTIVAQNCAERKIFGIFAPKMTLISPLKFLIPLIPALFFFDPPFSEPKKKKKKKMIAPLICPTSHQSIYEHSLTKTSLLFWTNSTDFDYDFIAQINDQSKRQLAEKNSVPREWL